MGLLNSLPDLHELAGLYEVLASSADSFDPPILRRCRALSERQRERLLRLARAPRPLLALTRDAIRRAMGRRLRQGAALLEIPSELEQFLLYQTV